MRVTFFSLPFRLDSKPVGTGAADNGRENAFKGERSFSITGYTADW